MKAILFNGSPRKESISKKIALEFLNNLLPKKYDIDEQEIIDLYSAGLYDYSREYMNDFYSEDKVKTDADIKQEEIRGELLDKFIHADLVIINTPKYNFSYPATVKCFIDTLYRPNVTYDTKRQHGDKGLLMPKKEIVVIVTSGDKDQTLDSGLETSIREAFEYLNLDENLTIIPVPEIHKKSPEIITKLLEANLN